MTPTTKPSGWRPSTRVLFTPEEQEAIRTAAYQSFDGVAFDLLQGIAEEKGKDVNAVTVSRAMAIEVALDAGRTEAILEDRMRRAARTGTPSVVTDDLLSRMKQASYKQLIRIVTPAFPYSRYGM